MRISDWSSDVCSSDLVDATTRFGTLLRATEIETALDKDADAFFEQCADSAVNGAEALRIDTLQSEWASTSREGKFTAAAHIPLEGVAQLAEGTDGGDVAIGQLSTQAEAKSRHV